MSRSYRGRALLSLLNSDLDPEFWSFHIKSYIYFIPKNSIFQLWGCGYEASRVDIPDTNTNLHYPWLVSD